MGFNWVRKRDGTVEGGCYGRGPKRNGRANWKRGAGCLLPFLLSSVPGPVQVAGRPRLIAGRFTVLYNIMQ